MSQTNLNEDLNIVANSNLEITLLDGDLNIIQALDDEPNDVGGLTSAELKAKFDEGPNKIKEYINGTLIPEILTEEATEADRAAAEAVREANEAQRIENENARIAAEQARVDETNGVVAQANQAAQSWAVGGTGTREGEDTNNAKYWSDKAREAAGGDFVPTSDKGAANGVATLGEDALLAAAQRPKAGGLYRDDGTTTVEESLTEISTTLQNKADLGEDGKVPAEQVDAYSQSDSISAETRTALSLSETATPDAALAEIARQLSESSGLQLIKLWENAAPQSEYSAQTIALDIADYSVFLISFVHYAPGDFIFDKTPMLCVGTKNRTYSASSTFGGFRFRAFTISDNGIEFSDGYLGNPGNSVSGQVSKDAMIPLDVFALVVS